ncbi:hypothetical protein C8Q77DRAFT_597081 [Trametes polyzona]|nr:hypothetical protein C8Q77DRAFT_597081 [Trametes polyzona]
MDAACQCHRWASNISRSPYPSHTIHTHSSSLAACALYDTFMACIPTVKRLVEPRPVGFWERPPEIFWSRAADARFVRVCVVFAHGKNSGGRPVCFLRTVIDSAHYHALMVLQRCTARLRPRASTSSKTAIAKTCGYVRCGTFTGSDGPLHGCNVMHAPAQARKRERGEASPWSPLTCVHAPLYVVPFRAAHLVGRGVGRAASGRRLGSHRDLCHWHHRTVRP